MLLSLAQAVFCIRTSFSRARTASYAKRIFIGNWLLLAPLCLLSPGLQGEEPEALLGWAIFMWAPFLVVLGLSILAPVISFLYMVLKIYFTEQKH